MSRLPSTDVHLASVLGGVVMGTNGAFDYCGASLPSLIKKPTTLVLKGGFVIDSKKAFYSVDELATILGMSKVTIRMWLAKRRLTYIKFGRNVRVPASELERLIAEGTIPARRPR